MDRTADGTDVITVIDHTNGGVVPSPGVRVLSVDHRHSFRDAVCVIAQQQLESRQGKSLVVEGLRRKRLEEACKRRGSKAHRLKGLRP